MGSTVCRTGWSDRYHEIGDLERSSGTSSLEIRLATNDRRHFFPYVRPFIILPPYNSALDKRGDWQVSRNSRMNPKKTPGEQTRRGISEANPVPDSIGSTPKVWRLRLHRFALICRFQNASQRSPTGQQVFVWHRRVGQGSAASAGPPGWRAFVAGDVTPPSAPWWAGSRRGSLVPPYWAAS